MLNKLKMVWKNIRRLSGDDAYEQYLQHYLQHQAEHVVIENAEPPLSREAFFKEWQDKKWKGIKRCC
ncbi:MAG: YbdD/YjiX family protein [Betaproteobacteria bacterium]